MVIFKRKCNCLIECSICKQRRSETVACKCDMQHAKLLSVKIDKSLSGGWEVPSGQEDCISAFLDLHRVNLKWMMGNIKLHENSNNVL